MKSSQVLQELASEMQVNYRINGDSDVKHCRVIEKFEPYSQRYERDPYSMQQNFLYKRAMFGLGMYPQEEVKVMHWQKRNRIKKVHQRAQDILNVWKQELANDWVNKFFEAMFPRSPITKKLREGSDIDPEFKNTLSFEQLGIGKEQIICKLTDEGVLPPDFTSL